MLTLVAYLLNLVLIATGVWNYLKLEFCWAGLGVGIGLLNLFVLYFNRMKGPLAILAAMGCVVAVVQGVLLGVNSTRAFIDKGKPVSEIGMWDLVASSHDFSYAIAYVGAGLTMLVLLAQARSAKSP